MDKKDIAIAIGCGFLVGLAGSLIVRSIKKPKKQSKATNVPTHQINTSDIGIDPVKKEQPPVTTPDAEVQEPVLDQHEVEEEFPDPTESSKEEDFEDAELPPIQSEDDHDSESTPTSEKEEIH
jgi:hypothetical protein